MSMNREDIALVQEFLSAVVYSPAEVLREDHGTRVVVIVRPNNSSRTLRIVATVTDVEEL